VKDWRLIGAREAENEKEELKRIVVLRRQVCFVDFATDKRETLYGILIFKELRRQKEISAGVSVRETEKQSGREKEREIKRKSE